MIQFIKINLFLFLFIQFGILHAQKQKDKVAELKNNFISEKIKLTSAEADKFWPIYNDYINKLKGVKRNLRRSYKKDIDNLSEKEAEEIYLLELTSKQLETDIHNEYASKIKTIIGSKKFIKLRLAEEEFRLEIIKNIKEKNE
jgi:hypothetical protein